ncbi:MAG: hypothetical protein GX022_01740 [Clostridiaceae bacterium]|nr:hypothetical protein [Clostridiaceae bacterium]
MEQRSRWRLIYCVMISAILISYVWCACIVNAEAEPSSGTVTVTYDGNGADTGSVPVDANAYTTGSRVQVMANTGSLAKDGFCFGG